MSKQHKKPVLVCLNNGTTPPKLTRYVVKSTGGFYMEKIDVVPSDEGNLSLSQVMMESVRKGKLEGQRSEAELEDQLA